MFSTKDIASLKEVIHNQGSWDNHTRLVLELGNNELVQDESAIKNYAKLLSYAISLKEPKKCYVAQGEQNKSYSLFQLVESSCIAGNFSYESTFSSIEIFSSKEFNLEKVLHLTKEFFDCKGIEVNTFNKIGLI